MSDREDDQTVDTVEIREVVGIVYNHNALEEMATQLVAAGVDRNDISLMADWNTVIEKLGLTYPDPGAVVDNPETPRRRLTTRDEHATVTGTVRSTLRSCDGRLHPTTTASKSPYVMCLFTKSPNNVMSLVPKAMSFPVLKLGSGIWWFQAAAARPSTVPSIVASWL